MVSERVICCCGASSWTRIIAWFQIVCNLLMFILCIVGLASLEVIRPDHELVPNKSAALAALGMLLVISILGVTMGITLLHATNQKHTTLLRIWLIYGIVAIVLSIITMILSTVGSSHSATLGSLIITGPLIALNIFAVIVVHIHNKEINEGVFIP